MRLPLLVSVMSTALFLRYADVVSFFFPVNAMQIVKPPFHCCTSNAHCMLSYLLAADFNRQLCLCASTEALRGGFYFWLLMSCCVMSPLKF